LHEGLTTLALKLNLGSRSWILW